MGSEGSAHAAGLGGSGMRITVPIRATTWTLTAAALVFAAGTLGGYFYKAAHGHTRSSGLIRLLDVDVETSIPTWFSSAILLVSAALLAAIGSITRSRGGSALPWYGLAIIFVGLSSDETAVIHEMAHGLIAMTVDFDNPLKTFWVYPYAAFAIAVLVVYWRFLFGLPARTRRLFLVAGGLYVIGALGGEVVSVQFWKPEETQSFAFVAVSVVEELLEMLGVIVFIHTLLEYLRDHVGEVSLEVKR